MSRAVDAAHAGKTPLLDALFAGVEVVTEELRLSSGALPIHPREAATTASAVPVRQRQFAAGRFCARRALARLGLADFVLLNDPDRAPIWPTGVVGSITHTGGETDGFCGVVVARAGRVAGVGVDAELPCALDPAMWPLILTPTEQRALRLRPDDQRGQHGTLLFSAKESVYKAVFPILRTFVEFHEVEIADLAAGRFVATISLPQWRWGSVQGRYLVHGDVLVTGVVVAAGGTQETDR